VSCTNLELLHLGANNIEYLPPEIFTSLTKLRELQLYQNKIQVLPPEVGNLQGEDQDVGDCELFFYLTS
jgi:Leucine-rich repeat (LRR) protein